MKADKIVSVVMETISLTVLQKQREELGALFFSIISKIGGKTLILVQYSIKKPFVIGMAKQMRLSHRKYNNNLFTASWIENLTAWIA